MNNIDKQYTDLLKDILENGVQKTDRTGTGTISVFGRTIRHKMSEGFPLLTTKKMYFKGIVTELLWFLRGDTNIKYLLDNDCHIWDGDAYKNYKTKTEMMMGHGFHGTLLSQEDFINKIKTDNEFAYTWGELGPVYGKQWRRWTKKKMYLSTDGSYEKIFDEMDQTVIDQIANSINLLKTDPDSRRNRVNAWNVGELDQMVLPPCHTDFQFYTRELSLEERKDYAIDILGYEALLDYGHSQNDDDKILDFLNYWNVPKRAISLMWYQRSVDTPLGLPFNIASYGLLLEIIAKMVNMVPDELIGNLGDTHIYLNQIDGVKEQIGRELTFEERTELYNGSEKDSLQTSWGTQIMDEANVPKRTREPFPLPKLVMSNQLNFNEGIDDFLKSALISDFVIEGYQSHPTIKFPLSN